MFLKKFSNLKRFGPRLSFAFNKYVPTKNYSISHYSGDNQNMVPFSTHVQQLSLGSLYCKFNNLNFYSKPHPYFEDFKLVNNQISSKFSFLKKRYRFFYFDRPESNYHKRQDFFSNEENDFPILENEKINYINNIHEFNRTYLYKKLVIKKEIDISNDVLVIHIRTGDIFYNNWHSMYVQNPLGYFLKISEEYEKVLVVSGTEKNNPILNLLKKNPKFSFRSGNFIEDFNLLLNAKNLATSGVSGFPITAAMMSQKLENFYHSNFYLKEHLNPEMLDRKVVRVHSYKINNYILPGKFNKSSENLKKLINESTSNIEKIS